MMRSTGAAVRAAAVAALLTTVAACTAESPAGPSTPTPPSLSAEANSAQSSGSSSAGTAFTATASDLPARLDLAVDDFLKFEDPRHKVRSVLVWSDGELILERYADGVTAGRTWNLYSVTKSVLSTLVGIAVAEKLLALDASMTTLLPDHAAAMNPRFAAATLRELLTMSAGLPGDGNPNAEFLPSQNWVNNIVDVGSVVDPGTFAYTDAGPHLIAAILARATGRSVLDYAREKLFDPLGIQTRPAAEPVVNLDVGAAAWNSWVNAYEDAAFAWPTDQQGVHTGSFLLKLTPRDMLKIGQLYLDEGRWNGVALVPDAWVAEATTTKILTKNLDVNGSYGYLWWLTKYQDDAAFAAVGNGGQLIQVVPGRRLIVVVTSELRLDTDAASGLPASVLLSMVRRAILPLL